MKENPKENLYYSRYNKLVTIKNPKILFCKKVQLLFQVSKLSLDLRLLKNYHHSLLHKGGLDLK